jgi:hypothetical protein
MLLVIIAVVLYIALVLAVAKGCSANTAAEEAEQRRIDAAVAELRQDLSEL